MIEAIALSVSSAFDNMRTPPPVHLVFTTIKLST
jgi:hypothetical protein